MSTFTIVLLVAVAAVVGQETASKSDELETAARSGNWDEFNKLLSKKVGFDDWPMPPIPAIPIMPPIPIIPPIPMMTLMPHKSPISKNNIASLPRMPTSKEQNKTDSNGNFSSIVISSSSSIITDENGNVITNNDTSVYSNNNGKIKAFKIGSNPAAINKFSAMETPQMSAMPPMPPMLTMPPMPMMPPMPTMAPMPNFTFPPFLNMNISSFKDLEEFGDNSSVKKAEAENKTTSIKTTCYSIFVSIFIVLQSYLYKH